MSSLFRQNISTGDKTNHDKANKDRADNLHNHSIVANTNRTKFSDQ